MNQGRITLPGSTARAPPALLTSHSTTRPQAADASNGWAWACSPVRRSSGAHRTGRGGAAPSGRSHNSAGNQRTGRHAGRGILGPGGTAAAARCPGYGPGRSLFPAGPRRGPPPAGEVVGAAGGAEPELAAATSGKRAAVRKLLAAIYGWFTKGFNTADLREAKALLNELHASKV